MSTGRLRILLGVCWMLQTQRAEYELIESRKELEGRNYCCYGVKLRYAGTEVCVEDLSLDRSEVEKLVKLCNELELSPLHFRDVLEDFLAR